MACALVPRYHRRHMASVHLKGSRRLGSSPEPSEDPWPHPPEGRGRLAGAYGWGGMGAVQGGHTAHALAVPCPWRTQRSPSHGHEE